MNIGSVLEKPLQVGYRYVARKAPTLGQLLSPNLFTSISPKHTRGFTIKVLIHVDTLDVFVVQL